MALRSINLSATLREKLRRKVRWLVAKSLVIPSARIDTSFDLGFCMHIQNVPKKQLDSLAFGRPEGIRAFIQSGSYVVAAADFIFAGKQLKLSYVHQGHGLWTMLSMLNKLEKKYEKEKQDCYAELIFFLLAPGPYIFIRAGKKKQFYHLVGDKLTAVSGEELEKQIRNILVSR